MPLVTPEIQDHLKKALPHNRVVIEKSPPLESFILDTVFFQNLMALLFINQEMEIAQIQCDERTEYAHRLSAQQALIDRNAKSFAGWQLLRLAEDPAHFHAKNTGWEQFFADKPTEAIVRELLKIGREIVRSIRLEFKTTPLRIKLLEKVIRGESNDAWAMKYWTGVFGEVLARQKVVLFENHAAQMVHSQAKEKTAVSTVSYVVDDDGNVTQKYDLPQGNFYNKEPDYASLFTTQEDELAWLIMSRIGMFGDPMFRAAMSSVAHQI